VVPREPLKRTADNNWVHVTCALWTPEVKFGNAKALAPSEGIPSIPRARYDEVCKACKRKGGACVACHQCRSPVHVECAHQGGYLLGFEVTPVKGSRRDQFNIVTINGETGTMSATVWCKEHMPTRTLVHRMHDVVSQLDGQTSKDPSAINALQLFAQNFKQADLTLTGTVRKANLIAMATKMPAASMLTNGNRRASTTTTASAGTGAQRASSADHTPETGGAVIPQSGDKVCITCGVDVSPKWWPTEEKLLANGHGGNLGSEAQKFMDQRSFQCHKCKKTGRRPVLHVPPPPPPLVEPGPQVDLRPPPASASSSSSALAAVGALTSPATSALAEPRAALAQFPWASPMRATPPPAAPPTLAPSPMQAPHVVPSAPLSLNPPHAGPSPMVAPVTQPPPSHHFPPPGVSYGSDWRHSPSRHPPPPHQANGGPDGPNPPPHPNLLRDLRPPPIGSMSHHQPPSLLGGQPMLNGVPPSPPRRGTLGQSGPGPYLGLYHHSTTPHQLPNLTNGGPPPRAGEPSFSSGLLGHRSPFSTPLGSPPVSRDGLPMSREPGGATNNSNPLPQPYDVRPATGASASPSLRNLLS
jgi:hypothetical protein